MSSRTVYFLLICFSLLLTRVQAEIIAEPVTVSTSASVQPEFHDVPLAVQPSPEPAPSSLVPVPQPADSELTLEPVVVSAASIPMAFSEVASSITVITAEEIRRRKAQDLRELLPGVLGTDSAGYGGAGQLAATFLRGAASERTLVLFNGVPMGDPMSPGRSADIGKISLDQVERIEIVRGPQSVVFGSGAMGGVVNILTRPAGDQAQTRVRMAGGDYGTLLGQVEVSTGTIAGLAADLGAAWEQSEGYSAAKAMPGQRPPVGGMEADGQRQWTGDLSLSYTPLSSLRLASTHRFIRADLETDLGSGASGDDPNAEQQVTQSINNLTATSELMDGFWVQQFQVGLNRIERVGRNQPDANHPASFERSEYSSRNLCADWRNEIRLLDGNRVSLGVNYQEELGMGHSSTEYEETRLDVRSAHRVGVFFEDWAHVGGASCVWGFRHDVHDQYGGYSTFRIAPAYLWSATQTRLKATYGTAFNAPTLYQLYSRYGNPNLQPETSTGWDAGIEQTLLPMQLMLGATYFKNDYRNQVDFQMTGFDPITWEIQGEYRNLGRVETQGWEVFGAISPGKDFNLHLGYTLLTANDMTAAQALGPETLLRRAHYRTTLRAEYVREKIRVFLQVQRVGPRMDRNAEFERIILEPYTLVQLTETYCITPHIEVFVKLDNLLDEEYEEVWGYSVSRRSVKGGVDIQWP